MGNFGMLVNSQPHNCVNPSERLYTVDLPQNQMLRKLREASGVVSVMALAVKIHKLFVVGLAKLKLLLGFILIRSSFKHTQMLVYDKLNIQAKSLVMALPS